MLHSVRSTREHLQRLRAKLAVRLFALVVQVLLFSQTFSKEHHSGCLTTLPLIAPDAQNRSQCLLVVSIIVVLVAHLYVEAVLKRRQ